MENDFRLKVLHSPHHRLRVANVDECVLNNRINAGVGK